MSFATACPPVTSTRRSDRHVLAATIKGGADAIVTYNLRQLPSAASQAFNIEAQHPAWAIYEQAFRIVQAAVDRVRRSMRPRSQ